MTGTDRVRERSKQRKESLEGEREAYNMKDEVGEDGLNTDEDEDFISQHNVSELRGEESLELVFR